MEIIQKSFKKFKWVANFCLKFILAKLTYLTLDFGAKCENPLFLGDRCFVVLKKIILSLISCNFYNTSLFY